MDALLDPRPCWLNKTGDGMQIETALLALHIQASPTMMYYQVERTGSGFDLPTLRLRIQVGDPDRPAPGWTVYRCDPAMVRTGRAIETIEILADLLTRRTAH